MNREVEIIKYDAKKGLQLCWENNFIIEVSVEKKETV